ncbi:MAG: HAD-IC family P-type ATPase, partial [Oscillospiraceae bacterium]|nr:HAD-IC family P-type ATPase [Oscillospiraceae bacterium]
MNNSNQLGLSEKEARSRLLRDGENRLARSKRINPAGIFAGQFKDVLVMVLLAATAVSVLMGEFLDAAAIIVIVILNAVLGFIQEFRAEKTLEALKKLSAPHAQVFRDGKIVQIEAEKLVRGDVVHLEAGGRIPADCRLINSMSFKCDESLLTGESLPVVKNADGVLREDSLCFMGTSVVCGHGFAEVVETGKSTQMGLISGMLSEVTDERTPLQIRLGELGKIIGLICLGVCFCVSILGIVRGYDIFAMLLTGISLAVAAIPEGLPAVVTISLALAVRRIYKQKALVNKLHSVETLGCADVICTDKTGTLTLNKMTVAEVFTLAKNNEYDGQELYKCGVLCNNSIRQKDGTYIGDPTEIALMTAAEKAGVGVDGYERTDEIPFDSTSMFMQVTVKTPSGVKHDYLKGSVETVLLKCPDLTQSQRSRVVAACNEMTGKALRTLAFAHRKNGASHYSFIGIAGMNDPLRPEIKNAVKKCKKAGITVVMLTGDHKNTAAEIAKQAGILGNGKKIVTGAELAKMSDEELASELRNISVYARVSPGDKLRIVRAFKSVGSIVAMTGDGVNDAPAVKEAAIGVSMGIGGTDVTKEAAHLVLLDDNFATLVSAVEQGRTIYNNIRKSMRYMLSSNIGEVL